MPLKSNNSDVCMPNLTLRFTSSFFLSQWSFDAWPLPVQFRCVLQTHEEEPVPPVPGQHLNRQLPAGGWRRLQLVGKRWRKCTRLLSNMPVIFFLFFLFKISQFCIYFWLLTLQEIKNGNKDRWCTCIQLYWTGGGSIVLVFLQAALKFGVLKLDLFLLHLSRYTFQMMCPSQASRIPQRQQLVRSRREALPLTASALRPRALMSQPKI